MFLFCSTSSWAQEGLPANHKENPQKPYVLRQRVEEVLLYCSVLTPKGQGVTTLTKSDFTVKEDGKPVSISHFVDEDLPVSLALVLDDSKSMQDERSTLQSAALTLVHASNREDEISVTNFAEQPYLDQGLTGDMHTVESAISKGQTISGGTALFDTVVDTVDQLVEKAQHRKQVIVVITDGKDNASGSGLSDAIHSVQRADGPVVYTIGFIFNLPGTDARKSRKELTALADETGGLAFFPNSAADADRVAEQVANDIRHQYTIAFHPTKNAANGYHTVSVTAQKNGLGRLSVRTRKGYMRKSDAERTADGSTK